MQAPNQSGIDKEKPCSRRAAVHTQLTGNIAAFVNVLAIADTRFFFTKDQIIHIGLFLDHINHHLC